MKTITAKEFFHTPSMLRRSYPGQTLVVTDNGKPSVTVSKVGRRPRLSRAELAKRAIDTKSGKKFDFVAARRKIETR